MKDAQHDTIIAEIRRVKLNM